MAGDPLANFAAAGGGGSSPSRGAGDASGGAGGGHAASAVEGAARAAAAVLVAASAHEVEIDDEDGAASEGSSDSDMGPPMTRMWANGHLKPGEVPSSIRMAQHVAHLVQAGGLAPPPHGQSAGVLSPRSRVLLACGGADAEADSDDDDSVVEGGGGACRREGPGSERRGAAAEDVLLEDTYELRGHNVESAPFLSGFRSHDGAENTERPDSPSKWCTLQ
mmetsp:Transcript_99071/g.251530  ORF Transcript_99071/g.251530 Transcript_99071/m.251530 type:complete len:220 (-) Transcript_99071:98-757(-)